MQLIANIKTRYINNEDVIFYFGKYINGAPALRLVSEDGVPMMTASVNVWNVEHPDGIIPDEDCIIIKDWSENEGIAEALMQIGFIQPPHKYHLTGYVVATEHKMAGLLLDAWHNYNNTGGEM